MFESDLKIFLRLLMIIALAGLLGWERESAGKAAGLRTHILVGVSALLFVVLGDIFVQQFQHYNELLRFDPIRIVEAVITGISFLGAGTIFVSRGKNTVKGLTTAASILTTAAIGMIVGLERYVLAVGSTVIIFLILRFLNSFESKIDPESETISKTSGTPPD